MGGPLTVVVLVAAGGAAEPTTMAIERAASEALGHTARVVVRESMGAPTDGEALALASEANEGAVVEVTWSDRGHRVAMLRVHLAGRRRWMERTIGFGAADADPERGRTIGLALASMLPDPDPAPAPSARPARAARGDAAAAVARAERAARRRVPEAVSPDRTRSTSGEIRYAMDFFGLGAAGLGGNVQTAGGGAALETFLTPWFALRIGGAVRGGDVAGAPARTLSLLATAGVELRPWATTRLARLRGLAPRGLRAHEPDGDPLLGQPARTSRRWRAPLSGVDAVIEMEWRLGESVDLLAGVGRRRDARDDVCRPERRAHGDACLRSAPSPKGACALRF